MKQEMRGGSGISWTIRKIICTMLQTDNHSSTSSHIFYRPDALPDAQPTVSKITTTEPHINWTMTLVMDDTKNLNFFNDDAAMVTKAMKILKKLVTFMSTEIEEYLVDPSFREFEFQAKRPTRQHKIGHFDVLPRQSVG